MTNNVIPTILLIPLLSAAVIALFLRRQGGIARIVSLAAAAGVCYFGLRLAIGGARFDGAVDWMQLGSFTVSIGWKFDDLAALMLTVVGIVGLCVHVFSWGYMHEDGAQARYFGGLSIFMFSMLGIVFADNLFMMFIFWELVGFSSWLLINHYLHRQSTADASKVEGSTFLRRCSAACATARSRSTRDSISTVFDPKTPARRSSPS